jgi:hypothetical protein
MQQLGARQRIYFRMEVRSVRFPDVLHRFELVTGVLLLTVPAGGQVGQKNSAARAIAPAATHPKVPIETCNPSRSLNSIAPLEVSRRPPKLVLAGVSRWVGCGSVSESEKHEGGRREVLGAVVVTCALAKGLPWVGVRVLPEQSKSSRLLAFM